MSKIEKLIKKILNKSSKFTYDELNKVLTHFGYKQINKGKPSGSRVAFINIETKHIIRLHKPHPENELKKYQKNEIVNSLKERGII